MHKEFDFFADFITEFGPHIYPEGMFIPTPRPKSKGALVRVDFKTRDGFQLIHATCEVVRCDEALPGMLSGMWVSFRVIDDASRDLVRKIYAEREVSAEGAKPAEVRGDVPKAPVAANKERNEG